MKSLLLDTFCKAGGAGMGYHLAGFDVVGIDIEPQKHYPFEFHQADALEFIAKYGHEFDVIHASPPCQGYSATRNINIHKTWYKKEQPSLVEDVRLLLIATGKPYIIENVQGAPLVNYVLLCGTMFPGLRVYRHRLFECNPIILFSPMACNHSYSMPASKGAYHTLDSQEFITCVGHNFQAKSGRIAMDIDWMNHAEMSQAIPPAYTKWIGERILEMLPQGRIENEVN